MSELNHGYNSSFLSSMMMMIVIAGPCCVVVRKEELWLSREKGSKKYGQSGTMFAFFPFKSDRLDSLYKVIVVVVYIKVLGLYHALVQGWGGAPFMT